MSISSITPTSTLRPSTTVSGAGTPVQPVESAAPLAPAVRIDVRQPTRSPASEETGVTEKAPPPDAEPVDRRISVDRDTKSLVYQVVDRSSGDVVVQIPDMVVLKNRAYAEAQAARNQKAERPLDKTA